MFDSAAYSRDVIDSLQHSPWIIPPSKVVSKYKPGKYSEEIMQRNREKARARSALKRATRVNPESDLCKPYTANSTTARR